MHRYVYIIHSTNFEIALVILKIWIGKWYDYAVNESWQRFTICVLIEIYNILNFLISNNWMRRRHIRLSINSFDLLSSANEQFSRRKVYTDLLRIIRVLIKYFLLQYSKHSRDISIRRLLQRTMGWLLTSSDKTSTSHRPKKRKRYF